MRDIVENTGLSKGAFYHYFKGKEELFKEIVYLFFELGATNLSQLSLQSLKTFIEQYLDVMNNSFVKINELIGGDEKQDVSFNFFFIMFDAVKRFPEFLQKEKEQYEYDLKGWEEIIQIAKDSGEIKSDSTNKDIADLFLYCTDGVFIRVLNSDKQEKYVKRLKTAFETIYRNLKV